MQDFCKDFKGRLTDMTLAAMLWEIPIPRGFAVGVAKITSPVLRVGCLIPEPSSHGWRHHKSGIVI